MTAESVITLNSSVYQPPLMFIAPPPVVVVLAFMYEVDPIVLTVPVVVDVAGSAIV